MRPPHTHNQVRMQVHPKILSTLFCTKGVRTPFRSVRDNMSTPLFVYKVIKKSLLCVPALSVLQATADPKWVQKILR